MWTVLAVSWAMFSGATGYMSLAPAAFLGMGIYSTALLQDYLPFPVLIVVGGLVSFVLALLLGLVTLRLKGIYFTIFSFGLVVFFSTIINYFEAEVLGRHGWIFIPIGIYIFIKGLLRFKRTKKVIKEEEKLPPQISDI